MAFFEGVKLAFSGQCIHMALTVVGSQLADYCILLSLELYVYTRQLGGATSMLGDDVLWGALHDPLPLQSGRNRC